MALSKSRCFAVVAALGFAGIVSAETIKVPSTVPVAQAVERLTDAVNANGARVFNVVDYAQGSASVGNTLRPTTLVIFGNPKIGADALQIGQTLGLFLPLRVLAYEDAAGDVWLMYEDPATAAQEHGIASDHPAIGRMKGALSALTATAAGQS
jgi:uncharacterized protein (DUF302 family)